MANDYYQTLNIQPDAEPDEIRGAYRSLARRYHPDRNSDPSASLLMAAINEAYQILSDPRKRAEYDGKRQKKTEDWDGLVIEAAKSELLRTGWTIVDERPTELILKHGSRQVHVTFVTLLDPATLQKCLRQESIFHVILAVRTARDLNVNAVSVAIVELLHSRLYAGEFPDPIYRELFRKFIGGRT